MITIKSKEEIKLMRESGKIVAGALKLLSENCKSGITTAKLDELAEMYIRDHGAEPAFLGYRDFPATVCISLNEQVVHGIPDSRRLKDGDIVSFDVGAKKDGFFGDAAITVPVGEISEKINKFINSTKESLYNAIEKALPGNRLGDISHAVETIAIREGYGVVQDFVGHGIGRALHEAPQVPNYGRPGLGPKLKVGMTLAIEPMFNMGGWEVKTLSDGWTVVTKDGTLSAHFEHVIAITQDGCQILTEL